jgi:hypothetical protein
VLLVAIGNKYLGWFRPKSRYLEHYLGGRDRHEELDKASAQD